MIVKRCSGNAPGSHNEIVIVSGRLGNGEFSPNRNISNTHRICAIDAQRNCRYLTVFGLHHIATSSLTSFAVIDTSFVVVIHAIHGIPRDIIAHKHIGCGGRRYRTVLIYDLLGYGRSVLERDGKREFVIYLRGFRNGLTVLIPQDLVQVDAATQGVLT